MACPIRLRGSNNHWMRFLLRRCLPLASQQLIMKKHLFFARVGGALLAKRLAVHDENVAETAPKAVVPCQNKIILKNFRPVGRPS